MTTLLARTRQVTSVRHCFALAQQVVQSTATVAHVPGGAEVAYSAFRTCLTLRRPIVPPLRNVDDLRRRLELSILLDRLRPRAAEQVNVAVQTAVDVKSLHAKIGELTLENDS